MPGNVKSAFFDAVDVFPQCTFTSYQEGREYPNLVANYHDGSLQRGQLAQDSRRTFTFSVRASDDKLIEIKAFLPGLQGTVSGNGITALWKGGDLFSTILIGKAVSITDSNGNVTTRNIVDVTPPNILTLDGAAATGRYEIAGHVALPFLFFNPFEPLPDKQIGSNWDPFADETQGRYIVVWRGGTWSTTTDIPRTNIVQIVLVEVG